VGRRLLVAAAVCLLAPAGAAGATADAAAGAVVPGPTTFGLPALGVLEALVARRRRAA